MKPYRAPDISRFRHLYPFRSRYRRINGLRYHYLDEGSGEPIVMVHGNPTWSFYYRELVKKLRPRFRAIVPDHIGCGLSDKPDINRYDYRLKSRINDLEALIDLLDLKEKITLVLHDWGGAIGMAYAIKHTGKIGRIIIMNTAAFFPPAKNSIPLRLRLIRDFKPIAVPAVLGLNLFAVGALYMASYKGLPGAVKSGLTAPYNCWKNRIATLKFVQDIPLSPNDPSYGIVKHIDENLHRASGLPLLICWGKHDVVFDRSYLNEWRRRFPDAEVHFFEKAGHYVLEDEPDKIARLVETFLEKHPI